MKDAHGYGSNARGGDRATQIKTAGLRGVGLASGARFTARYSNAQQTVDAMRAQMRNAGPGHRMTLWQGIKNLMGA